LQRASAVDDLLARVVEVRDRIAPRAGRRRCCSRSRPICRSPISMTSSAWRARERSTA
jgi:hypothetical protein